MTVIHPSPGATPGLGKSPIRVMLVDDSLVARSIFSRVLGKHDQIEIVCEAEDSEAALSHLDTKDVDIILLDIEMPKRSGLEALPDIQAKANGARILIVSAFAEENGPAAIQALSLGACDTLAKPGRSGFSGRFSEMLVDKVVRLGQPARRRNDAGYAAKLAVEYQQIVRPTCIAIGASTGGIPPIYEIVRNLDPALDCPVFITQHLPEAFMSFFARQLDGMTHRTAKVAEAGEAVQNDHIYIAPGDAHLVCGRVGNNVVLDHLKDFGESRYCPSVDAMFHSLAKVYGAGSMGIVLSGMGNDGASGAKSMVDAEASVLVQDVDSSVVWGMPGAVAREGHATAILSPPQMTELLGRVAKA